jgi:hypothetical protein
MLFINICQMLASPLRAIGSSYSYPLLRLGLGLIVWCFIAAGMKRLKNLMLVHLFTTFYLIMVVLWAWPPDRFVISVLPILLLYAYYGLPATLPKPAIGGVVLGLLTIALFSAFSITRANGVTTLPYTPALDWKHISAINEWIRKEAKPGAVIAANYDPTIYLYTGHKAIRPFVVDNLGLFYAQQVDVSKKLREMDLVLKKSGAKYLVQTSHDPLEDPDYSRLLEHLKQTGRARLIIEFVPEYCIYELSFNQ